MGLSPGSSGMWLAITVSAVLSLISTWMEKIWQNMTRSITFTSKITGYPYGCREQIENRLISLAATTFPSGTELMHVTPDKTIGPIARKGGIAPRTEMLHGAMGERQINGGLYT